MKEYQKAVSKNIEYWIILDQLPASFADNSTVTNIFNFKPQLLFGSLAT